MADADETGGREARGGGGDPSEGAARGAAKGLPRSLARRFTGLKETERRILLSDSAQNARHFCSNHLKTSKYEAWNFLALSLFEQFRKAGNIYFLLISFIMILGTYTDIFQTPITFYTTLGPLMIVLGISMAQEGLADLRRHRADREVNNSKATIVRRSGPVAPGGEGRILGWSTPSERGGDAAAAAPAAAERKGGDCFHVAWKDMLVGDLVLVRNMEQLPADLILLASSSEGGSAYIETSSIDGETNLKLRRGALPSAIVRPPGAADATGGHSKESVLQTVSLLDGQVECELPNISVNTFLGRIAVDAACLRAMAGAHGGNLDGGLEEMLRDGTRAFPLDIENMMLRGSVLRNTEWAVGIAVYTGRDTKLAMNTSHPPAKLSRVDSAVNAAIRIIFLVDLILVTVSALLLLDFEEENFGSLYYLGYSDESLDGDSPHAQLVRERYPSMDWQTEESTVISGWLTYLVLFNNFIPLSMYVTLEIVTFIQLSFVNEDIDMYDETTDTPARARSNNVTDLGMIQYVFSDKTGTLTQNVMRFKMCSAGGMAFGDAGDAEVSSDDAKTAAEEGLGAAQAQPLSRMEELARESFAQGAAGEGTAGFQGLQLLRIMALCHTVVVEADRGGRRSAEPQPPAAADEEALPAGAGEAKSDGARAGASAQQAGAEQAAAYPYQYQAESPDEGALVEAARERGVEFLDRTEAGMTLKFSPSWKSGAGAAGAAAPPAPKEVWQVLAVNKFDAERKRMSVLLREPEAHGGRAVLLVKGADNCMLSVAKNRDAAHVRAMEGHLVSFAELGLRTLVLGYRYVEDDELAPWMASYAEATQALVERDLALSAAAKAVEVGITIVGSTAIEDRLQDRVPETIASLAPAGVKLWVLTGDKRETAINIGYSAKVLGPTMDVRVLRDGSEGEVHRQIADLFREFVSRRDLVDASAARPPRRGAVHGMRRAREERTMERMELRLAKVRSAGGGDAPSPAAAPAADVERADRSGGLALVMEGPALLHVLHDEDLELALFHILHECSAVIACRVSPKQKALLVRTVKKCISPTPVTLAIGDGANDVAMLQEAQVGVGISGREGQQAVNSSDFAISQFRFLTPLLLVHGRWSYRRQSKVVLYSFYKNLVLVVNLFCFSCFAGFSGSAAYEDTLIAGYNFFLGMPIIMAGIFDRDLTREYILRNPWVYVSGRENLDLNVAAVCRWILEALVQGVCLFGMSYFTYGYGSSAVYNGYDYWSWSSVSFAFLLLALHMRVLVETETFILPVCPICPRGAPRSCRCLGVCQEPCCSRWSWTWFFWLGSIAFFYIVVFTYCDFPRDVADLPLVPDYRGVAEVAFAYPTHGLLLLLSAGLILTMIIGTRAVQRYVLPFRDPVKLGAEECYLPEPARDSAVCPTRPAA